jgi:adenosylcobyric acid synthase
LSAAAIMVQGTGSDVGKSLLVAGLARAYTRRGLAVRPFKPQNMSNNAAVTADGGEIGRAQALQARACGVDPCTDMNPVLLKPQTDIGAQIVVGGRVRGNVKAADYPAMKADLMPEVLASYERLAATADLVLVEGAGSPAEINLQGVDIANMGFAAAAHVPVVLVGDIERGGVIASIVGTMELLSTEDRARIKGYVVNKFRGDPALFESALGIIGGRTGLESFGVVPWFAAANRLPAEDAASLAGHDTTDTGEATIRIAVPVLSRIANFDDLDPLRAEPDVAVRMVPPGHALPGDADLIILTGTKATIADLAFLREQGWDVDIRAHHRRGGAVLGICGGYQMLGRRIADPDGIEGAAASVPGLGLLEIETVLTGAKTLKQTKAVHVDTGETVAGFEMHVGRTTGADTKRPMLRGASDIPDFDNFDGAISADMRVQGCYLHGLFASDRFRHAFLDGLHRREASGIAYDAEIDRVLDNLALHLEDALDIERILEVARAG